MKEGIHTYINNFSSVTIVIVICMLNSLIFNEHRISSDAFMIPQIRHHKFVKTNIIPSPSSLFYHARNQAKQKNRVKQRGRSQKLPTIDENDALDTILEKCNFSERLVLLDNSKLPILAEVHADGKWQMCIITGFKVPSGILTPLGELTSKSLKHELIPPLVNVILIHKDVDYNDNSTIEKYSSVVDIGQLTFIWEMGSRARNNNVNRLAMDVSRLISNIPSSLQKLPVNHIEKSMQILYDDCSKGNISTSAISKKEIAKICTSIQPPERAQHVEQILRKGIKVGFSGGKSHLVDSTIAAKCIIGENNISLSILNQLMGAILLAKDSELGGRFKRTGCIFLSADYQSIEEESPFLSNLKILNGGWSAVDKNVKEGTEARKFAERGSQDEGKAVVTNADERILHRLENFAMGEVSKNEDGSLELEVDLRQVLSAMKLPLTPQGAQMALIKSGIWSSVKTNSNADTFQPWSPDILESTRIFVHREENRLSRINDELGKDMSKMIEGRTNLLALPAVCIDAKRATFRDDAIGVRPRSSTGRKVIEAASKWEILVHITDVSDLYSPDPLRPPEDKFDFGTLRKAAESRAISRYDLPFGPLHLIPPAALQAIALKTKGFNDNSDELTVNRCVTLWAYIDERDGKLLDSGLERSIISAPHALTFERASDILDKKIDVNEASMRQVAAVLLIAERNLSIWKLNRLKANEAAAQRENRLQVKEMIGKEIVPVNRKDIRDDGFGGSFQRTRGHKLVDQALDLYGSTLSKLLKTYKAPIPRASGSTEERDGRVATAPLRRYIDGVAQRQALSVLCGYGGHPMSQSDCKKATLLVNEATKMYGNLDSSQMTSKRMKALKMLESHLVAIGNSKQRVVPALTTGKQNQVVISGLGLIVKCDGVNGSLKGGKRVLVQVTELNVEKGILKVNLK